MRSLLRLWLAIETTRITVKRARLANASWRFTRRLHDLLLLLIRLILVINVLVSSYLPLRLQRQPWLVESTATSLLFQSWIDVMGHVWNHSCLCIVAASYHRSTVTCCEVLWAGAGSRARERLAHRWDWTTCIYALGYCSGVRLIIVWHCPILLYHRVFTMVAIRVLQVTSSSQALSINDSRTLYLLWLLRFDLEWLSLILGVVGRLSSGGLHHRVDVVIVDLEIGLSKRLSLSTRWYVPRIRKHVFLILTTLPLVETTRKYSFLVLLLALWDVALISARLIAALHLFLMLLSRYL